MSVMQVVRRGQMATAAALCLADQRRADKERPCFTCSSLKCRAQGGGREISLGEMCLPKIRQRPVLLSRGGEVRRGSRGIQTSEEKQNETERKGSVVWNADSSKQLQQLNFREKFSFLFPLTSTLGRQKSTRKFLDGSCSLSLEDPQEAGRIIGRTMTVICCARPLTSAAARRSLLCNQDRLRLRIIITAQLNSRQRPTDFS